MSEEFGESIKTLQFLLTILLPVYTVKEVNKIHLFMCCIFIFLYVFRILLFKILGIHITWLKVD